MSTITSPQTPSLPTVDQQNIQIFPSVIDEWYGIFAIFSWEQKIDQNMLDACIAAQNLADQTGSVLLQHVFRSLRRSTAWAEFYGMPHSVECDVNGSDSSKRTVTIPVFSWKDACNYGEWDFSYEGGNILIDIR